MSGDDSKKKGTHPTIVNVSAGGSLLTEKIMGPHDPRYKNGGEAASVAISVQRKIADVGAFDLSAMAGVAATAFAPSELSTPNPTLGKYALERPPALVAQGNLGLLAAFNHDPGKAGFFGAAYFGGGLQRSFELSRDAVVRAKQSALDALDNGIKKKEAAAKAIEDGNRLLESGKQEYDKGVAALEAGRVEFAEKKTLYDTNTMLLQTGTERYTSEFARYESEATRSGSRASAAGGK